MSDDRLIAELSTKLVAAEHDVQRLRQQLGECAQANVELANMILDLQHEAAEKERLCNLSVTQV